MKRSISILLLVTVAIMLAMVTPALAKTGTKSGGYWPYSANFENTGDGAFYTEIHGVGAYEFAGVAESPHEGYSSTTGKCKVCHAVHGAGITDADTGTTLQPTEKLLRSTAEDACSFCHLTNGTFAIDPYASNPMVPAGGGAYTSIQNYYGNESLMGNALVARSGHNATHGHDNPQGNPPAVVKSYQGCVSCHAVHGANTMTDGALSPNILKNDPAKGVTAAVGSGWGTGGEGYGSKYAPTTTQAEFCEDCHDGTKLVNADGSTTAIVSQDDFNTYFPSCGVTNTTGSLCHNSVQRDITESVAQFGAFNNAGHNGRSHIMTATINTDIGGGVTGVTTESIYAEGNGCATCHNITKYSRSSGVLQQGSTFPHFAGGTNELIQGWDNITESDNPCMNCHGGKVGVTF